MKNILSNAICILIAASIAMLPYHSSYAATASESQAAKDMERRIQELASKAQVLRGAIKRERFDPEARVESADYDLPTLVSFVRDEIAFHPYAGTLRGAAGTLRARAGNSLDQSLLLAQMMRTAGFDARIARTDLSFDIAQRLLHSIGDASAPESLDYFREAIVNTFGEQDFTSRARPIEESTRYQNTQRHTRALLAALEEAGVELTPRDATDRLLESIRSYFWVQYRDGPSQPWQEAHPAFGSYDPPETLEPEEIFADTIPEQYQHRFEVAAWIEQWLGDNIEKHRIMSPWSAPVAELNSRPIRFQNVPNGINRDNVQDVDRALADSNVLTPFFGKRTAPGAKLFDLQGRVIDPMAQGGSPAAGIIKTVGDKFVVATTDLADREDGKPAMALHSVYLEFTFHRPGGEFETRRRYILPPRESYDEDRVTLLRQLMTAYTYVVATGNQSQELIADRFIEGTVSDLDWLKYVVLSQSDQEPELPEEPMSAFPTLFQQWNMDRFPVEQGIVRFHAQPTLIGIRDGIRGPHTTFSEVDVVWNTVESIRKHGSRWFTTPHTTLTAGVWDTVLESIPLSGTQAGQVAVTSAPKTFDLAEEQGIELLVLRPGQHLSAELEALPIHAQERQFVRRDLDAGYVIVIPQRTPTQSPMAGWWRVRPDSGETLGMLGDGYGATATEYIVVFSLLALAAATALRATTEYSGCGDEGGMKAKLCCAVGKHLELVGEEAEGDQAVEQSGDAMYDMACGD